MEDKDERVGSTSGVGSIYKFLDWLSGLAERSHQWLQFLALVFVLVAGVLALLSVKRDSTELVRSAVIFGVLGFHFLILSLIGAWRTQVKRLNIVSRYVQGLRAYTVDNIDVLSGVVSELQSVTTPQPPEEVPQSKGAADDEGLKTRERNTLLAIIAALCKEARIDYSKPAKAASTIKNLTVTMGLSVGESTIEEHLKRVPEAVEARSR